MPPVSPPIKESKVRETHSTAGQILEVARERFGDDGYDATSVAEIARRVGVVEGAIYRHFPSKRDLLHQVIRSFYEPLIESATAGVAFIDAPRERVRFLIRRQLEAMAHDPLLCRLIISEARSFDDYYESEVAQLSRRYTSLFVDAYRDGAARGDFRNDVPAELVRDMVYGSIEHLAWSALSGHRSIDLDTTTDQLFAVVCGGIEATASTDPGRSLDLNLQKLETVADRLDELSASLERGAVGSP
jgi:AcrR family transcriptional regulator